MKMSPPLTSLLTMPATGLAGRTSASADTNKVAVVAAKTTKGRLLVTLTSLTTFALLSATATTAKADDFELAMVIKETTNPYYNATLEGARIAAKEIGGTANNYGPTQSSGQAQVELINNLADRHIRAIAIAPSDPDAVVPAMKRAQLLVKTMEEKGKVAIVSAQPTAANQNAWIKSFRDELKKYKDIEIVDEVYGYDNEQKAFDATVALTTKYLDLTGIFAPTCPGLPAVAGALESVHKAGAIKVSGNCVPSITGKYMLDGTIQGFYLWDPIKLGYVTYYAAKNLAEGKIQGKAGDSFTIAEGKWPGKYEIDATGQIITGEPLQFTPDNIKDYNF